MKRDAKTEQLKVPGDISHLSELRDFVTDVGEKYQLPGHLVRAFKLAVDEAATNIIQHAYHDQQSFITLQAVVSRNRVTMVLIDQGDYFDPNWAKEPDIRNYVEEGKRGGLGIFIMRRLIDEIEYRKTERGNELHLTKHLSVPLEGLVQEERTSQPVSLRTRFLRWALTVFTFATVAGFVAFYFKAASTTEAVVLETGQSLSKQIASQIGSAKPDLLLDANGKSYINAVALPVYQENVGKIYSLSVEDEDGLVVWSTLTAEINHPFARSERVTRVAPNAFVYRTIDGVEVYEFQHAIEYLDQPARFKKVHVLLTRNYRRSLLKNRRLGYLKVAGTILGAGYILIVLLSTLLLHPLHNLTTWIKAQKKGDAAGQIDVDAASEIGEIARAFSEMTEKFRESQQHLARQERFEKEMQVAKDIQRSLLPLTTPNIQDFEIATYYEAAQSIGGDYYDFIDVGTDTLGIAIADVAGKGVPGSLVMTMVRTALRTEARGVKDAAEVLARVNDFIIHDIKNGMFVTLLYLILDTRNHVLNFASAGHTPMILHRPQWQRTFFLNPMGFPIGIQLPDNKLMGKYLRSETIQLLPDDMLLLYTDGVTEAMNRRRELYGEERLLKVLRENSHLALSAFADKLRYSIYSFTEGNRQLDDITFLAIRDKGGADHQESTVPSAVPDTWNIGNRFLSIEDITKVLDIVVTHPEFEVDEILAALNSEKYHYTIVKREALENELLRRRLHTAELRKVQAEMYSAALRPLNPPGTPQLTLSGHPRILQRKPQGARVKQKKSEARKPAKASPPKKPRAKKKAKPKSQKSNAAVPQDTILAPKEELDFVLGDHIDAVLKTHKDESKAKPPEQKKQPPPDLFDVEDISDSLVDSLLAEIYSELERKAGKTKPPRPAKKKSKPAQEGVAALPETAEKADAVGKDAIEEAKPEATTAPQPERIDTEAKRQDQPTPAAQVPPKTTAEPAAVEDKPEEPVEESAAETTLQTTEAAVLETGEIELDDADANLVTSEVTEPSDVPLPVPDDEAPENASAEEPDIVAGAGVDELSDSVAQTPTSVDEDAKVATKEPESAGETSQPEPAEKQPEPPPSQPTDIPDRVREAIHLYQSKRYEDAIIMLNQALKHDAGLMRIRQLLGNAYYRNGMFEEAVATYEEALALGAPDVELRENLGVLYAKIGDYPRAKEQWQAVLRQHPERNDIAKRLNRLTKLLHRKPEDAPEKNRQTPEEAVAARDEASTGPSETQVVSEFEEHRDDEEKEHLLAVGVTHYRNKDYDAAIQAFKHAVELFPDLKEAYLFLGNAYFKTKKFQQAAEIYELLQQMEEENMEAHENLGLIYARTGSYQKALHQWGKLLESQPEREDVRVRFQKVSQLAS